MVDRLGGMAVLRSMLLRLRGCALAQLGDLDAARSSLEASADIARTSGATYELGLTLDALAAILEATGSEGAVAAGSEAREILEPLGVESTPRVPLSTTSHVGSG
jgi:hypothetical protein